MKCFKYTIILCSIILVSCLSDKKYSNNDDINKEKTTNTVESKSKININKIQEEMCEEFPKELILKYNTDATHIEIKSIDNGSGGILHCNIKLFYGEKDYEYWKGQVSAGINQMKDPFWQYNPERNTALYHKIDGFGEKAVFITNTNQLLILKDGIIYQITPPNRGRTTNTGKENKAIALEIASYYKI